MCSFRVQWMLSIKVPGCFTREKRFFSSNTWHHIVSAMNNRTFDKCTTILYTEINTCKFQWTSPLDVGEEQSNDFKTRH